jgi:hypothetical protein
MADRIPGGAEMAPFHRRTGRTPIRGASRDAAPSCKQTVERRTLCSTRERVDVGRSSRSDLGEYLATRWASWTSLCQGSGRTLGTQLSLVDTCRFTTSPGKRASLEDGITLVHLIFWPCIPPRASAWALIVPMHLFFRSHLDLLPISRVS